MEKSREGMSLNYKINGEVTSFKTVDEFIDFLSVVAKHKSEPLTVEPLDVKGLSDYDHMDEIMERSTRLALRSRDLLEEIMDISTASEKVYESDRKAQRLRVELSKHKATA
jgi:hypothetical protein